jgi:hypothetical protein
MVVIEPKPEKQPRRPRRKDRLALDVRLGSGGRTGARWGGFLA